ncbi:metallophosphoesterase [Methanoculleus sp.]|uniref:metallophosphoesterase family protein n=1 Tax=Methanoculleus sp. TaxID=90427 RepID=UPI0025D0E5EA|nr:metallophosphoesterase [Methanoculleus sp.]MCK9317560.1 metallophosphoesterase [Methanoculleus sp.]MDD2254774.1 metallophosphoesterase [Methanoculleus sp.]MDD2788438.1 metallophosphoesterase [Methanoculleus sp.]MDD3216136.1 metallophosphoesterase [Methanoculleus sp.]MDD4470067.1 metallophosphoesterase [Methanoculleus sp.]
MTDVLLLADLHGNYGKLDAFLSYDYDAVIIAGDITNFGPLEPVDSVLSNFEVPCFAIPGNCDPREIVDVLERSDAVCLHNSWIALGKITLAGLGGSNQTPFGTPFELTEKEIDGELTRIVNHMDKNIHNVLISHAPPYGALDSIGEEHVGCQSIRKHMTRFDLVCCAHIHEARGIAEIDGVTVVNPGPASEGYGALIHFGTEPKEIQIDLIAV